MKRLKEGFAGYDKYVPPKRDAPIFGAFSTKSESEVLSILMRMPEKFCNLDPVPAKVLKQLAPYLIKKSQRLSIFHLPMVNMQWTGKKLRLNLYLRR